jgi:hypothetical protein
MIQYHSQPPAERPALRQRKTEEMKPRRRSPQTDFDTVFAEGNHLCEGFVRLSMTTYTGFAHATSSKRDGNP